MPVFEGPTFKLGLPQEYVDLSTYAFAFPSGSGFQPSLVIKFERWPGGGDLAAYVNQQLSVMQGGLAAFQLLERTPGMHGEYPAVTAVFQWGSAEQPRLRQKQRFILVPARSLIYTLTATNLDADFAQTEKLFDAIMGSFAPK